ncbi:hypothetical protein PspLS_04318 [Pyricularia sp. CBS 133598]|nr:hypothetical protein PspLS_04318 [Pyricularia sp. CBS 133598]
MVGKGFVIALLPLITLAAAVPTGEHKALDPRSARDRKRIMGIPDVRTDECGSGRSCGPRVSPRPAPGPARGQGKGQGFFESAGATAGAYLDNMGQLLQPAPSMPSGQGRRLDETVVYDEAGNPHYAPIDKPDPRRAAAKAAMARAPTRPKRQQKAPVVGPPLRSCLGC